jgi:SAM-dependent methyltransferase
MMARSEPYDSAFFATQAPRSLDSARVVLERLFPLLRPRRVADIGCGVGTWMRAALDLGAEDAIGVDGDYVDRATLVVDPALFLPADLASQSLPEILGARASGAFDLVICVEVAEHLPHTRAASFITELTSLADIVLFSAAVPFQYGTAHVNEQWPEYWAIHFREQGFVAFDPLRAHLWGDPRVEWWYAQNLLVFARKGSAAEASLPPAARADGAALARVHPESLLANLLGLPRRYRKQASAEEFADYRSLAAANQRCETALPRLEALERAAAAAPEARDVFPWTRTEVYQPEEETAEVGRHLLAAERAYRDLRKAYDAERERHQAHAAARLFAETRAAELSEPRMRRHSTSERRGLRSPGSVGPLPPPRNAPPSRAAGLAIGESVAGAGEPARACAPPPRRCRASVAAAGKARAASARAVRVAGARRCRRRARPGAPAPHRRADRGEGADPPVRHDAWGGESLDARSCGDPVAALPPVRTAKPISDATLTSRRPGSTRIITSSSRVPSKEGAESTARSWPA